MIQDIEKSPMQIIKSTINKLKEQDNARGLEKGDTVSDFELEDQNYEKKSLSALLRGKKYLVISFFRGRWCGYCKSELKDQNSHYERILQQNAELVAISPQTPEDAKNLQKELGIKFPILSDPDLRITAQFGLIWNVPEKIKRVYFEDFDLNIPKLNANGTWQLPVPATFIINNDKKIIFKFADLNYSKRVSSSEIIEFLHKKQIKFKTKL